MNLKPSAAVVSLVFGLTAAGAASAHTCTCTAVHYRAHYHHVRHHLARRYVVRDYGYARYIAPPETVTYYESYAPLEVYYPPEPVYYGPSYAYDYGYDYAVPVAFGVGDWGYGGRRHHHGYYRRWGHGGHWGGWR